MHFELSISLTKKISGMGRTPGVRYLRDKFESIGCSPDLSICEDLVDKIRRKQVSVIEGTGWNSNYIFVRVGEPK